MTATFPADHVSVLADPAEPSVEPASALSAVRVFAWRSLLKLRHTPEQAADAILIPFIFTVLFTYVFGGALSGSPGTYLEYLLPGTLVMGILIMTVYGGLSLNTDVSRGVLDRFRALPVWQPAHVVGTLLGDVGRYVVAATLVVLLGLVLGWRPDGGLPGVVVGIGLALVFAYALSWLWATVGLLARSPQAVSMLSFVIQFPLTFVSNAFVDPETMPSWLQGWVEVNPVSLLVTAERALFAGTATVGDVAWVLLPSAAVVAVFAPLTLHLYRRKTA
ncbi:ABC transporter permease [Mumia sp. ZJ1417]|uniref:ABC transporter permease n=1 Tax=Mumia sp. ZJ1417 TaxID=2708082 RepID=UPI00141FC48A|nr:ABC transporter permease [Mumia sp. ZJ1417]QMW66720.1 ABC transporter permease [Mumia sp. ZJ1417]